MSAGGDSDTQGAKSRLFYDFQSLANIPLGTTVSLQFWFVSISFPGPQVMHLFCGERVASVPSRSRDPGCDCHPSETGSALARSVLVDLFFFSISGPRADVSVF